MNTEDFNAYLEPTPAQEPQHPGLEHLANAVDGLRAELAKVVVGQQAFIDLLIAALLAGGHVLVEGVPGIAKTLTAKLLAQSLDLDFSRIQFTPDLMPSDVVGTTVFNMKESEFTFNAGPVFANLVLIDEINRAPAKTQSALFEVMEEGQVTVDGKTYPMTFPFFVVATQNPIEQEGTYKLPEAQLDRFLVKIIIDYPSRDEERSILQRFNTDFGGKQHLSQVNKVMTREDIHNAQKTVEQIFIKPELLDYIADLVTATRNHSDLFLGASPRASLAIMRMAKAVAAMEGRSFVTPDDIQSVAFPVLNHRIILTPEREMEGYPVRDLIDQLIQQLEVPR